MDRTNDALWLAFEALAKTYPHDDGVRMTADLARWLVEEGERRRLSAPPILKSVVRTVTQVLHSSRAAPIRQNPLTGE
jgi:hypothetical protein